MIETKPLPYKPDELEPNISQDTMKTHHGKHYTGYVNNLNKLIKGTIYEDMELEDIVKQSSGPTFNNAAQVWNHEFYFNCLTSEDTSPSEKLEKAISDNWGSVIEFTQDFNAVAKKQFGSGWTWLVWDTHDDSLNIYNLQNADNPLNAKLYVFREDEKYIPLLTCDLWEHAFYLDVKNERGQYLDAFWSVVNWDFVNKNFDNI